MQPELLKISILTILYIICSLIIIFKWKEILGTIVSTISLCVLFIFIVCFVVIFWAFIIIAFVGIFCVFIVYGCYILYDFIIHIFNKTCYKLRRFIRG